MIGSPFSRHASCFLEEAMRDQESWVRPSGTLLLATIPGSAWAVCLAVQGLKFTLLLLENNQNSSRSDLLKDLTMELCGQLSHLWLYVIVGWSLFHVIAALSVISQCSSITCPSAFVRVYTLVIFCFSAELPVVSSGILQWFIKKNKKFPSLRWANECRILEIFWTHLNHSKDERNMKPLSLMP